MRQLTIQLAPPGQKLFEPIFTFTSFDAWARIYNNCLSLENVAAPERLMNFGRAGWRAICDSREELDIAKGKLLCYQFQSDFSKPWRNASLSRKILLKLLAVLAPRLAITASRIRSKLPRLSQAIWLF
jgi:hypothetical protein